MEIVLLLDCRENMPGEKKRQFNTFKEQLLKMNIKCEKRSLSLSDMMWIIRPITNPSNEFVLNCFIERKTISDFVSSHHDGRFNEQIWRLKTHCKGSHIIYLLEGDLSHVNSFLNEKIDESSILKSIQTIQINEGFITKFCSSVHETVCYLRQITMQLSKKWISKTLFEISSLCHSFRLFSKRTAKSSCLTVSDVFAKQLLLILQLGPAKVKLIIEHYPTLPSLLLALENFFGDDSSIPCILKSQSGKSNRLKLSETMFSVYNTK